MERKIYCYRMDITPPYRVVVLKISLIEMKKLMTLPQNLWVETQQSS
jgi:hypothetical protein